MSIIKTYRDLEVWQRSMDLTESIYEVTSGFPTEEMFGLKSQIRRAAVSIPSNIAEGHARKGKAEFLHHLSIARGSLAELETQLLLAIRLKLLDRETLKPVWEATQSVGKLLTALIKSLR